MNHFENKIYNYIRENNLITPGSLIVLGVSGGADSVGLLTVLASLKELLKIRLTVVHINHCLRGQQADEDQAYTQQLCTQMGLNCRCFRKDIAAMAQQEHLTEEEAGRNYRYDCFRQVMLELNADCIAVAHHMDDAAETVMMNLLRGTGIRGLAGIRPRRGHVIRPLLCVTKREIEDYLVGRQISWRTDLTNLETDHTRNKIRNELLPYVNEQINPASTEHLVSLSWMMADVSDYLDRQAAEAVSKYVKFPEAMSVDGETAPAANAEIPAANTEISAAKRAEIALTAFTETDIVIQREMLRQVIHVLAGRLKDIHLTHIEDVRGLAGKQVGSEICLPYHLKAVKRYETLDIIKTGKEISPETMAEIPSGTATGMPGTRDVRTTCEFQSTGGRIENEPLAVPGSYPLGEGKTLILSEFITDKKGYFPEKAYTKWLDYDKIGVELGLRTRRQGDYMILAGGRKKQLRRIMMDDKIPADMRERMPVLAAGNHVLWLIGTDRISESVKISENTRHILCAELECNI